MTTSLGDNYCDGLFCRKTNKYGWKRELPDHRNKKVLKVSHNTTLPQNVDLRSGVVQILDQGDLGSCTSNAIASCMQFLRAKENVDKSNLSRLFIYYNERVIEGTVKSDSGAEIKDGIKVVSKLGVPRETDWPYDITKFKIKPPSVCYKNALTDLAIEYKSIDNTDLSLIQQQLALNIPIVCGFSVYESFESDQVAKTGVVPLPGTNEQLLGGHCVLLVGYDNVTQRFTCLNSWGKNWGSGGFFTIPYAYLTNSSLASDFWQIEKTSPLAPTPTPTPTPAPTPTPTPHK